MDSSRGRCPRVCLPCLAGTRGFNGCSPLGRSVCKTTAFRTRARRTSSRLQCQNPRSDSDRTQLARLPFDEYATMARVEQFALVQTLLRLTDLSALEAQFLKQAAVTKLPSDSLTAVLVTPGDRSEVSHFLHENTGNLPTAHTETCDTLALGASPFVTRSSGGRKQKSRGGVPVEARTHTNSSSARR